MPTVADSSFTLDAGTADHERTFDFPIPSGFSFNQSMILAFIPRVFENAHLRIYVNHNEIYSASLNADNERGMWETFHGNNIIPPNNFPNNSFSIRFIVSTGRIRFRDIVLWHQIPA